MPPSSSEVHSFTFGPSNGQDQYVDQIAATLLGPVFNPIGVLPERAAARGHPAYPAMTRQRVLKSGFLDSDSATAPEQHPGVVRAPGHLLVHLPDPPVHAGPGDGHPVGSRARAPRPRPRGLVRCVTISARARSAPRRRDRRLPHRGGRRPRRHGHRLPRDAALARPARRPQADRPRPRAATPASASASSASRASRPRSTTRT